MYYRSTCVQPCQIGSIFGEKLSNDLVFLVHYVKNLFLEQCTVLVSSLKIVLVFT